MFLELSEVLVCPRCRPAQGLVVLVDEIEDRRVREGRLGCPECEARVPVRGGVMRFDLTAPSADEERRADRSSADEESRPSGEDGEGGSAVAAGPEAPDGGGAGPEPGEEEEAGVTEVAALLGVQERRGYLLLGPGLASLAPGVARRSEGSEVLALAAPGGREAPGVTWARGIGPEALPVVSGRLGGVALLGGTRASVSEAGRVLAPAGRLVVLRPSPGLAAAAREAGLEIVAHEDRALVAVRPD